MWRPAVVTAAPTTPVISLDQAKDHLGVEHDDHNAQIELMLAAALAHVERRTGQRLAEQVVTCRCSGWEAMAALPVAPIAEVTAIRYFDGSGIERALAPEAYEARIDGLMAEVVPTGGAGWPAAHAGQLITLEARVGYEPGSAPFELVAAAKLILGDLYAYRETAQVGAAGSEIKVSVNLDGLLENHRIHLI